MSKTKHKSKVGDVYQHVTDKIVAAMEAGLEGGWEMPWMRPSRAGGNPHNAITGRKYNGINVLLLWMDARAAGYSTDGWATFKQWKEAGTPVRKGERASLVTFWKELDVEREHPVSGEAETVKIPMLRHFWVFNADQVEGFEAPKITLPDLASRLDHAEAFIAGTKAKVIEGGYAAYYRREPADEIHMPPLEAFKGSSTSTACECYYSTLLHELTHWSGAKHRLDRTKGKTFGDSAYAFEELVAELGAAFLCAELDITVEPRPDHAKYIASWLKTLKGEKRAIFRAAGLASKAATYLAELQPAPVKAAA